MIEGRAVRGALALAAAALLVASSNALVGCGQGCDAPLTEAALLERGIELHVEIWKSRLDRMGIHSAAKLRARFPDCCKIWQESIFEKDGKRRYVDMWAVEVAYYDDSTLHRFDRCGRRQN